MKGKDHEEVSQKLALFLKEKLMSLLKEREVVRIGLAGGRTPRRSYSLLKDMFSLWDKVRIFPTDERYVPISDTRSNYRMLRETLGEAPKIYRIKTDLSPEEACREFDRSLEEEGPLDLILLGLGEDGHTASLFPGVPCEPCGGNACLSRSPDGLLRISMSLEFINRSREKVFLVTGEKKRKALERLLRGEDIPASGVRGEEVILFTDLTPPPL